MTKTKLERNIEEMAGDNWFLDFELDEEKKILTVENSYRGTITVKYSSIKYTGRDE